MIIDSFTTIPFALFSLLFAYVSHHICLVLAAAPPHYLLLPISLNSLDLAGVRLLSPRDSQILPKLLQVPMRPVQMTLLSSSGSSMKILFVVLFLFLLIMIACDGLSWDTPAGYKLSRAVPAVMWQMGIC